MRVFISPRYLELLAQRMRNAGLNDIEITHTDWIVYLNQAINAIRRTEYRAGIDNEFAEEEGRLSKLRSVDEDPVLRAFRQDAIVERKRYNK